ncbi:MAG TPA: hypothetical protein VHL30_04600 [Chlamydiales bacterium]|jgi:hypothetical protein|nr:hypothetical protein [Chlamydiales bacterium]
MIKKIAFLSLLLKLLFLTGCYKNHLYVQQEWIDERYLASTRVNTPDPRKGNPPNGQKLLVKWDFPKSQLDRQLTMLITVRLWNNSEQIFSRPVERKRDYIDLFFPTEDKNLRILTYKVEVFTKEKELVEVWKHHFWTELIDVRDNRSSARQRSSAVSSQPKQGSVMETP